MSCVPWQKEIVEGWLGEGREGRPATGLACFAWGFGGLDGARTRDARSGDHFEPIL
jgi:hypothetical protein